MSFIIFVRFLFCVFHLTSYVLSVILSMESIKKHTFERSAFYGKTGRQERVDSYCRHKGADCAAQGKKIGKRILKRRERLLLTSFLVPDLVR